MAYEPDKFYRINSGKREGKALEVIMFNNPSFPYWHLDKLNQKHSGGSKNRYHRHLEWITEKGKNRHLHTELDCPVCNQEKVKQFSVVFSANGRFSIGSRYTCCGKDECKRQIKALAAGKSPAFLKINWPSIFRVASRKISQKRIADMYRQIFDLSTKRLTAKAAFEFFKK